MTTVQRSKCCEVLRTALKREDRNAVAERVVAAAYAAVACARPHTKETATVRLKLALAPIIVGVLSSAIVESERSSAEVLNELPSLQ
jgi:hypothetical protein